MVLVGSYGKILGPSGFCSADTNIPIVTLNPTASTARPYTHLSSTSVLKAGN